MRANRRRVVRAEQVDFAGVVFNKVNEFGGGNAGKCIETLA